MTGNMKTGFAKINSRGNTIFGESWQHGLPPSETLTGHQRVSFKDDAGQPKFGLTDEILSKHLLLLGGPGSGKTNTFNIILSQLLKTITENDLVVIFDTKGDFRDNFYKDESDQHILLGNDFRYRDITKSWNIFEELKNESGAYDEDSELTVRELSRQLFKEKEQKNNPFFSDAAIDIISMVIIDLIRCAKTLPRYGGLTTKDFLKAIRGLTELKIKEIIDRNSDFTGAASYILSSKGKIAGNNQAMGVLGTVHSVINNLFMGVFSGDYGHGNLSMRKSVREKGGKVIFIEYDLGLGEALGPMYRILFDLAFKEALGGRPEKRGNIWFIIDEASLLPGLTHLADALSFGRGLGVKVMAGLQSIMQFNAIYEEAKAKVLTAGFMNSFCFQTWDLTSREFISERFGKKYESISYKPMAEWISFQREGFVVEDWDILSLDVGEAFVNLSGYSPFRFHFQEFGR